MQQQPLAALIGYAPHNPAADKHNQLGCAEFCSNFLKMHSIMLALQWESSPLVDSWSVQQLGWGRMPTLGRQCGT